MPKKQTVYCFYFFFIPFLKSKKNFFRLFQINITQSLKWIMVNVFFKIIKDAKGFILESKFIFSSLIKM